MAVISVVEIFMNEPESKTVSQDAFPSFVCQKTLFIRIFDPKRAEGLSYSYTLGTGGPTVLSLLKQTPALAIIGNQVDHIQKIWHELCCLTHDSVVRAITSLVLAAIDTTIWDLRCKRSILSVWRAVRRAHRSIPLHDTEGDWLNHTLSEGVYNVTQSHENGFPAIKVKESRPIREEPLD